MSILPTHTQGSTSSSSSQALSQSPNSIHGSLLQSPSSQLPQSPPALSCQIRSLGSLDISESRSPGTYSVARATKDSGGSLERVTDITSTEGNGTISRQDNESLSRGHSGGERVKLSSTSGKMSWKFVPQRNQQPTELNNSPGNSTHSAGRKGQMINGNHLLNFQYDPISRSQQRAPHHPPPPRRQHKRKPYNKDLFIQANYKFVVLDSRNCTPESMDPDRNLKWEDIICVRYATPFPVQCPICLEYPLCAQITSCGHVFCFPCILRYLIMGKEEDNIVECWKRCPLCFVMISAKDLYTVEIENVKQYHVGDNIELMLLTRQKDSFSLSQRNGQETLNIGSGNDKLYDTFSKFTLTSDVDLSVRKAISELDSWLAKADAGLVDDLEKLPYVCVAMEQLEQRKKYWNEHRVTESDRSCNNDHQIGSQVSSSTANATNVDTEMHDFGYGTLSTNDNELIRCLGNMRPDSSNGRTFLDQIPDVVKLSERQNTTSSSCDESKSSYGHSNDFKDAHDKDSYNFYQAVDGQHLILHPLNMKCMLHHFGSYDMLPNRISGKILQIESMTQSEAMRRRFRYLSHFSLTTTFQLCEIDLGDILPPDSLVPFTDEIMKRDKQRKQLAKKERKEKLKAEATPIADYVPTFSSFEHSSYLEPPSMDDFEALGTPVVISSSPPTVGERKLFSSVTKLGFAAAHDSPGLKIEESSSQSAQSNILTTDSHGVAGSKNASGRSFANIISRAKSTENMDAARANESGKKGKKPSRVLLSTAGGRRY